MRHNLQRGTLLLGQTLNHFDTALYGFLAPVLAPLFFPSYDPVVRLILIYSVLAIGILGRPLGGYLFGLLAAYKTPAFALFLSLLGIAVSMLSFAALPSYAIAGPWSPFFLIIARLMLDFFVSGERTIAALYLLDGQEKKTAFRLSGFYETAGVFGIFCASVAASYISSSETPTELWRLAFLAGSSIGFVGIFFRHSMRTDSSPPPPAFFITIHQKAWRLRGDVLRVAILSCFSYLTYAAPFLFLNSYIPEITTISYAEMMNANTFFLCVDMALPLFISRIVHRFTPQQTMRWAVCILMITSPLLFYFLKNSSFFFVSFVRSWIIFWGIVFVCPLNIWKLNLFRGPHRYLLSSFGSTLGSSLLGRNTTSILFLCVHLTAQPWGASIYVILLSALTLWALQPKRLTLR